MLSLSLLSLLLQAPAAAPAYRISAVVAPDRSGLDVTAELTLGPSPAGDSIRIGLGAGRFRLLLLRPPRLEGSTAPVRLTADSSQVVLPGGAGGTLHVEYRFPLDQKSREQLGYDLLSGAGLGAAWYPTVPSGAGQARFSDFEVSVETAAGMTLIATGAIEDSTVSGDRTTRRYRGSHLEGFALAIGTDHVVRSHTTAGITVRALSPVSDTLVWDRVATEASRAAAWYRETYGFFPLSELGIVPGSPRARGGFPLPGMFMIHQGDLSPDFVRWITAHELAHYYWGLYVLADGARLDWLMLALGIWTDQLYLSRSGGVSLAEQWRSPAADNSFEDLAIAEIAGYDRRLDLPAASADSLEYDYNSYVRHGKGAVGLYLLSQRLGTDHFVEYQRQLLGQYRDRPLSLDAFARGLEEAGVPDAAGFLRQWARGDARIDYAIRSVEPVPGASGRYLVRLERTGTIAYPLTLEARSGTGPGVRVSLDGTEDSAQIELTGPPSMIRLDPDGLVPMPNSGNPDMQLVYLRALGEAGPLENFLVLAEARLALDHDPVLAALVAERLFEAGRYGELRALARRQRSLTSCTGRVTCMATLQLVRAMIRGGRPAEARVLLNRTSRSMHELGLGRLRRLAQAGAELPDAR